MFHGASDCLSQRLHVPLEIDVSLCMAMASLDMSLLVHACGSHDVKTGLESALRVSRRGSKLVLKIWTQMTGNEWR